MRYCISTFLVTLSWALTTFSVLGQTLPPNQPEQDCINALPVCQNVYVQPNSYTGEGAIPNEIVPAVTGSCLGSGEENDVWYIFTVQTAGDVCFDITPNNPSDDYDWAVYNLTNSPCSDIAVDPALEVSCNFSGATGCGGVTGPNGSTNCPSQNEACIPVLSGETYVVNVSNFSGTASGYTLDFAASTAVIFDNVPPEIDSLVATCDQELVISFSENILCSSVQPTDFVVTEILTGNNIPVLSAEGDACLLGGTFENEFLLTLSFNPPQGLVSVTLVDTVLDNCGNVGVISDTDTIFWPGPPVPLVITTTLDTLCQGQSTTLSVPNVPGETYTWSVPGTDSFVVVTPMVTTTYSVTAISASGCVRTADTTIVVVAPATADFTATPQACVDSIVDVVYTGVSNPGATFDWEFDPAANLISGAGQGPFELSFAAGGAYALSLVVLQDGCTSDTVTNIVVVPPKPTAQLSVPLRLCSDTVASIGLLTPPSPSAIYTWDFDGGIITNGASGAGPYEIEWTTSGVKSICLTVEENGCFSNPICAQVTVDSLPGGEIVDQAPQCFDGNEFAFTYDGSSAVQVYDWQLDDNVTSTLSSPLIQYDSAGIKTVILAVTDFNGCTSRDTLDVQVFPSPVADFSADTACRGDLTTFSNLTTISTGGNITQYVWQLGNGNTDDVVEPQTIYASTGIFNVTLVATSSDGCTGSITSPVLVNPVPSASFTFSPVCEREILTLENRSSVPNGPAVYAWTLPNGELSEEFEPTFIPDAAGIIEVQLQVFNEFGCSDTFIDSTNVLGRPTAAFETGEVCEANELTLTSSSQATPGDDIVAWQWQSGDGGGIDGETYMYIYDEPRRYLVTLTVESGLGCRDSISDSVTVWAKPQASFEFDDVCEGDVAIFTSTSETNFRFGGQLSAWDWDLGPAGTGGGVTASGTYGAAGEYRIQLVVRTDKGCLDTLGQTLTVDPVPDAPITENDSICNGDRGFLRSNVPEGAEDILWYDERTAGQQVGTDTLFRTEPLDRTTFFFAEAVSEKGCRSERTPTRVLVAPELVGQIQASPFEVEMPDAEVAFAVGGNFTARRYMWNFGDGESSTEAAPVHTFQAAGRIPVVVDVVSQEGCPIRLTTIILVQRFRTISIPTAFSPNDDGINEEFFIGTYNIGDMEFVVYNRWGQVVFSTEDPNFRWDGKSPDGRNLPSGVYVYRLSGTDAHGAEIDQTGTISLIY